MVRLTKRQIAARDAYVNGGQSIPEIARALGVVDFTVKRWRLEAKKRGDDWDKARYQAHLSKDKVGELNQRILAQYLETLTSATNAVYTTDMTPIEKTKALVSLADSYNKMISAMKRTDPEVAVANIAVDVLTIVHDTLKAQSESAAKALTKCMDEITARIQERYK
jgi:transposase